MPLPHAPEDSPRRLLRDEIYTSIYDAIIDGTLEPGETLRDEELISWLGVSRTPIRQALNRLADIGLVEMTPGRNTKIAEFDAALVNQATYTTGILHVYSARVAIPQLSADDQKQLEKHLVAAKRAARADDLTIVGPAIRDFFDVFHHAAENTVLMESVERLNPLLLRFLSPRSTLRPLDEILAILGRIADAAREHDATSAVALIELLYTDTREAFLTEYRPRLLAE